MEQIFPILILLLVGMGCKKIPAFPADTDKALNLFVIYVALPALILIRIPQLTFSPAVLIPVGMSWAGCALAALSIVIASRLFRWSRETTGALLLVVPLGNTSFLGIPMVKAFFGNDAVSHAVLYDQFGSFLALSTYGSFILSRFGTGGTNSIGGVLKKTLLFPPFLALNTALLFHAYTYPQWLQALLDQAAAALVPVVMVAVGFQMRLLIPLNDLLPFIIGLTIRMAVIPLIFLSLCTLFGLKGPAVHVSIFETAMPPMVTAGALASVAGLKPRLAAAMVGGGIFLSFLTLPLLYRLMQ